MGSISQFLQGSSLLMTSMGFSLLARFFTQVIVVRSLAIEEYGVFAGALAIVAIFEGAAIARSGEVWLYRMPALLDREQKWPLKIQGVFDWIWKEELLWTFVAFGMLVIAGFVYIEMLQNEIGKLVLVLGMSLVSLWGFGAWKSIIILSGNIKSLAAMEAMSSAIYFVCVVAGAVIIGMWGVVVGHILSGFIRNFIAAVVAMNLLDETPRKLFVLSKKEPKKVKSSHAFLGSGLYSLFNNVDLLILSIVSRAEYIAVYKVGKMIANLVGQFFVPFWNAIRPRWLRVYHSYNGILLFRLTVTIALALTFIAFVALGLLYEFGDIIIPWIFGAEFSTALGVAAVLLLGQVFMYALGGWTRLWVIAQGVFAQRNATLVFVLLIFPVAMYLNNFEMEKVALSYISVQALWLVIWLAIFARKILFSSEWQSKGNDN